jgi:cytochrome P450
MWDDLAGDLIRLHQEKPEFTEAYLRKMIVTNFGAGHETMASTLTSLMAMIGTHRDVQGRLAEEVRQNHACPHNPLDQDHLSYLHAVLKESKRLHPVVAMSLPRSVPAAGLTLHGYFFAAGTTVGCSPIALQRNEEICGPGPSTFNPDRWQDEKRARDMEMYSLSWGGGARSCPGRHLAEMLVWNICIAIIAEFDIEVVKVPTEDEMPTYFLSMMTGVKARFIPVAKDQSV